eukprot:3618633-Amphidinium_carterae.2
MASADESPSSVDEVTLPSGSIGPEQAIVGQSEPSVQDIQRRAVAVRVGVFLVLLFMARICLWWLSAWEVKCHASSNGRQQRARFEVVQNMPRSFNSKKNQGSSAKNAAKTIPKYLYFAKACLAAYCDENASPLYLKDHDEPSEVLTVSNIVAGRNNGNCEWTRRPGMAMTLACSSMQSWLSNLDSADTRKAAAKLLTWSKTENGKKMLDAVDGLNVGKDGSLKKAKIEKHVKTLVSGMTEVEEQTELREAVVTLAVHAGQMYLGSMALLEMGAFFTKRKGWAKNLRSSVSRRHSLRTCECG